MEMGYCLLCHKKASVHIWMEDGYNCYCEKCIYKYKQLWVSCSKCGEQVYMSTKPKSTVLNIHLKCNECENVSKK